MPTFQTRDLVDSLIREALTAYAATVLSLTPNILITLSPLSRLIADATPGPNKETNPQNIKATVLGDSGCECCADSGPAANP